MAKKISINILSPSSIENAQKQIEQYQKTLVSKCEEVCRRLAKEGIEVAQRNTGGFGKYITFTYQTEELTADGCKTVMIATNTGIIRSEWRTKDGEKTADVSPMLMCEFGSGLRAENPKNVKGVGTGTFPSKTAKEHATDPNGWYYMDLDGVWHHSYGMKPYAPMYKAWQDMFVKAKGIVEEVFGSGS